MRFQRLFWAVVFAIVASIGIRPVKADDAAERVFYNARIFTAEPEHPYAEAKFAVKRSLQSAVGQMSRRKSGSRRNASIFTGNGCFQDSSTVTHIRSRVVSHSSPLTSAIRCSPSRILLPSSPMHGRAERECVETSFPSAECHWLSGPRLRI